MELYEEILLHEILQYISQKEQNRHWPENLSPEEKIGVLLEEALDNKISYQQVIRSTSYRALRQIRELVYNPDNTRSSVVEEILHVFENLGSTANGRHYLY